jgi:transposase
MNIMHTMASDASTTQARKRRFYSPELKLQIVEACAQSGASIAGLALQHGINANIVHRWLREHSQGILIRREQTFVPVTLSAGTEPATAQPIKQHLFCKFRFWFCGCCAIASAQGFMFR